MNSSLGAQGFALTFGGWSRTNLPESMAIAISHNKGRFYDGEPVSHGVAVLQIGRFNWRNLRPIAVADGGSEVKRPR
jgi:hypothetical protein